MQEEKKIVTENKMGVMPINRLLINISLPMMVSMLVQALYNIVDSMFVARLSEKALTAVSLAFPFQMLLVAVGVGTGVGMNAVLSRALGQRDFKKANRIAGNAIFLAVVNYLFFLVIGILTIKVFYISQTNDTEIVEMGISYLLICTTASIGMFFQFAFERLLQATGLTFYSMISQLVGAIINIILDPIMIFGLFGFPKMGIAGAAAATVIGQIIGAIVAGVLNIKKNKELKITLQECKPDIKVIGQIYQVGIPAMIMQAIGSVMTYGMNLILIGFTSTATAVFGVYFKLQSFVFMPIFGLTNGMISIAAYNYGAGKKERFRKVIKSAMVAAVAIMTVGTIAFLSFTDLFLKLFDASDAMLAIGIPALRIISLGFILAGYSIVLSAVFQSLGNGVYSMVISIARQLVVILPVAYLLGRLGGLQAVWWAFPIAELVSLVLSTIFYIIIYRKVIVNMVKE